MTDNRPHNRFVIFALILIVGLGLALALPWLANSQGLAAHQINAPTGPGPCYAQNANSLTPYESPDAEAVQQAVDAASPGDVVKVAGTCIGIVERAGLTQTVYISKSITLEGGHTKNDWTLKPDPATYPTILHANRLGRVIVISGTQDVTLDSLYMTGGVAEDFNPFNDGGGIWSNSEIILKNSILFSNTASVRGGGMYNLLVSPLLRDVTFSGNSAGKGGAMFNNGYKGTSSPSLRDVTFSGNSAGSNGGGMFNYGSPDGNSSPILTNIIFSGNSAGGNGGAMYNQGATGISSPELTNVIFSGNYADSDGGAMYNKCDISGESSPILTNVTFSGNYAGDEGGAMNNNCDECTSNPELTNVTFSGNRAGEEGGAMYNDGDGGISSSDVRNSILWNNQDSSGTGTITATIRNKYDATITLTNSLVEDSGGSSSWALDPTSHVNGGGNIDTDPMFITSVDPSTAPTTTGNLRLQMTSPAIDKGNNDYVPDDVLTDLDGEARIKDGTGDGNEVVDMGAYEAKGYFQLTVTKAGVGKGTVTSTPAGIDCGDTCSDLLYEDTSITLAAAPETYSKFTGWSGPCTGTGDCALTIEAGMIVTATFKPDFKVSLPIIFR